MKSLKKVSFVLASLFILADLSAKAKEEKADVYAPTDLSEKMKAVKSKTARKTTTNAILSDKIDLAESSMFMYNFVGMNVNQEDVSIFYDPAEKEFGFNYDKNRRYISFDRANWYILKDAFEKYEKEFEEQTLSTKHSKTVNKYGTMKTHFYQKQFLKENNVRPVTKIGYVFIKGSPYFMVTLQPTKKTSNIVDQSQNFEVPKISLAFTRNQMRTFLEATSDENIAKIAAENAALLSEQKSDEGKTLPKRMTAKERAEMKAKAAEEPKAAESE